MSAAAKTMNYRYLGNTGLLVSTFSLGCMSFDGAKVTADVAYDIMVTAYKTGVNFFDNAELYGAGLAETIMGQCIQRGIDEGVWSREDLVISGKIFFGTKFPAVPNSQRLTRKHIIEGMKATLKRIGSDYVDLVFCHRQDVDTPIEETVRAMNFVIKQSWTLYWGTSEWSAHAIQEACEIADRLGMIRPAFEQPEFHIFQRSRQALLVQCIDWDTGLNQQRRELFAVFSISEAVQQRPAVGFASNENIRKLWYHATQDLPLQRHRVSELEEAPNRPLEVVGPSISSFTKD